MTAPTSTQPGRAPHGSPRRRAGGRPEHPSRGATPPPALLLLVPLLLERLALAGAPADVCIVRTGMGRRRALAAARRARRLPATAVGVAGFCGALDDTLRAGDVVVATGLVDGGGDGDAGGDPPGGGPDAALAAGADALVAALRARGVRSVHTGRVVSSARIVHGSERARLAAAGALAADMESAWLRDAADGRPFAVLRVVLDTPSTSLARPLAALRDALTAWRALRRAAPALAEWARATGGRLSAHER